MPVCDICSRPLADSEMVVIPPGPVVSATMAGFFPRRTPPHYQAMDPDAQRRFWSSVVEQNSQVDWGLCQECHSDIMPASVQPAARNLCSDMDTVAASIRTAIQGDPDLSNYVEKRLVRAPALSPSPRQPDAAEPLFPVSSIAPNPSGPPAAAPDDAAVVDALNMKVAAFATDIGTAAAIRAAGGTIQRFLPRTLIPTADEALGLNGALIRHFDRIELDLEEAPERSEEEWREYLDARFEGLPWRRWFGSTPSAKFSIVVAACAEETIERSAGSHSHLGEASSDLRPASRDAASQVPIPCGTSTPLVAATAPEKCRKCHGGMMLGDLLCQGCGAPQGWEPIRLPQRERTVDLTCPSCPDILIPADGVFLLEILDVDICCPTCKAVLHQAQRGSPLDLAFLDSSPHMAGEDSLVAFSKATRSRPLSSQDEIVSGSMVPADQQLAGLHLLRWLEMKRPTTQAIREELVGQFLGRFRLGAFSNSGANELHLNTEFLTCMHYGSLFIHRVDDRFPGCIPSAHGARGRLILNLMASLPRWSSQAFASLPYDARLALTELVYTLRKDYSASLDDAGKRAVHHKFASLLRDDVPSADLALGCRKARAGGCFIATACYGSHTAPEVLELRRFRDQTLQVTSTGRVLIAVYYATSRPIASWLGRHPRVAAKVRRTLLDPAVRLCRRPSHPHPEDLVRK